MDDRTKFAAAILFIACGALAIPSVRGSNPPVTSYTLPSMADDPTLPPLPERSARNANYTIEARLDPENHTIEGTEELEWRNIGDVAVDRFPFHLYWNAFRNNLSTSARGEGRRAAKSESKSDKARGFGYTDIRSVQLLDETPTDISSTLRFVHPDDDNAADRTVAEVATPRKVAPGETVRFRIDWVSKIPYGDVGRAGWVHDYNFIVQWFPKIGVLRKGAWNAHEFHPTSEFFADYGVYDVALTLPKGFVVGATGALRERKDGANGTETFRFHQDDVHDFAWTASRRFLERKSRFEERGYPPVDIRLLLQPEHAHLAERYIEATKISLRCYGAWSAPYPYPQITVVDPAWMSASGGMEYPTLLTGGAHVFAPAALQSPEGVTIHETGHQFWYGLVGNNEFEEPWLDEGFNSYHDEKSSWVSLGPEGWGETYFGLPKPGGGMMSGYAVVAPGVWIGRGAGRVSGLRRNGALDVMARRSWDFRNADAYGINAYGKPALSLQTLENLVGDETMTRILRTYARRYRYQHPTTDDFIRTVNEVTGKDYRWFFDETWFSSDLCDYSVEVKNTETRRLEGYADAADGAPMLKLDEASNKKTDETKEHDAEITVSRRGGVRLPVEVLVVFADGTEKRETWDGRDRWTRFTYKAGPKAVRAAVDPDGKLALDVDPSNNAWIAAEGTARRAATKWALRYLVWLQNLLELHTVLG